MNKFAGFLFAVVIVFAPDFARAQAATATRIATVAGHRVAYRVLGSGGPALVMISGLGDGMKSFEAVAPELAKRATVIVYDRAGYGASETAQGMKDATAADRELSAVLAQSGVPGPYVLLGHSLGGLYAEYFASLHPGSVAGLILEESRPAGYARRCEATGSYWCAPPAFLVWFMAKGAQSEAAALTLTEAEVSAAAPLRGKPVLVLSRPGNRTEPWTLAQAGLAARYPGSVHLTSTSGGHDIHHDQPVWFTESVGRFLDRLER